MSKGAPNVRYAEVDRESPHNKVHIVIDLEGGHRQDVATGFDPFDSLLREFAICAGIDLGVSVEPEPLSVDHHVASDVGAALGLGIRMALQGSDPVVGIGSCLAPYGDALVGSAVDFNSFCHLAWTVGFKRHDFGRFASENIQKFFESMAAHGGFSAHVWKQAGGNDVDVSMAVFRSFGRSFYFGTRRAETNNSR